MTSDAPEARADGGGQADQDATLRHLLETSMALREQLRLEEVVTGVASRLIGTDPQDVPAAIRTALGELAKALGATRGHFLRGSQRQHPEDVVYLEWYDPDVPQGQHRPSTDRAVRRWWRDALQSGRVLRYDDVEDLRAEAPDVVDALRDDGVRSLLHIPLPPHQRFWGFLTFSAVEHTVTFSDAAVALTRLAGECFLSALATSDAAAALLDARRELEHRNEELERSNEELERFAYAAAHDLKAPLARIEMALSAAPSTTGPAADLLDIARRGASRMRQLIEDLLAFAAVGQARDDIEDVDLDGVLSEVLADLEPMAAEAGVTVERPGRLPVVRGSRALFGQLLQNLVGNAIKFVRSGVEPRVVVSAEPEDDGVTLTVADNGIGIAPHDRSKVFGVFTRLNPDEAYPGSGVGLATCHRVVQHHGGRIWIEDGIDGGTAVRSWLPVGGPRRPAAS